VQAQTEEEKNFYPTVGRKMPEIEINHIKYFNKSSVNSNDFKGKWVVFDFWNRTCGTCVARFPKVNSLNEKYGDRMQFLLVGLQDDINLIQPMFDKFKARLKLTIPCAFDSAIFKRLDIGPCPHIVIVDPNGIVRGVTSNINEDNVKDLLAGRSTNLETTYFRSSEVGVNKKIDLAKPLLVNGNGGTDSGFLYRSLIFPWDPSFSYHLDFDLKWVVKQNLFQLTGITLNRLYNYGFIGKYGLSPNDPEYYEFRRDPIIEMKDSIKFQKDPDPATGRGFYCFSLSFKKGEMSVERLKSLIKSNVDNFFGLESSIEKRQSRYWSLICTSDSSRERLKARNSDSSYIRGLPHASFTAKNIPVLKLIYKIYSGAYPEYPIFNDTGINGNIDLTMDCILTSLEDVKRALRENGLDLVLKEREMKAIVIRDAIH